MNLFMNCPLVHLTAVFFSFCRAVILCTCTLFLQIQNLQSQSSRISLSITIQAPLIIIPVSSTSFDAIVANLGQLRISNSFNLVLAGEDPSGSDAVVVDKMVVELSSVQLLRFESYWVK